MIKPRNKRIPQYRAIALANSFAVAARGGKKAKIIDAIHAARKHDKDYGTNFLGRIARLSDQEITAVKKMRVGDLTNASGLKGRLHDAFKVLASEMEEAIQRIAVNHDSDARYPLRRVAPAQQYRHGGEAPTISH